MASLTDIELLNKLAQECCDNITNLTDEELRKEFEEDGEDLELVSEITKNLMLHTIKKFKEDKGIISHEK